tara:strand:- start:2259 stop:3632 length:1374 start_codon:yes stop_codon:yes gene_type:complete
MRDTSFKYSGEPTAKSLASGLATLGRYGDDYMVHAAEGETFVPKEILEANPELKENLFKQMTMMGIENPNRYVVGNEFNSINPITGQPEFFFKKIFKAVKKVAKKILPVAAPIIGNLIAPGIGGILASGLTSKLTGGSWGDAAKSMALSYGAGAIGRGLTGGFSYDATPGSGLAFSGSGFGTGLQEGLTQPFSAFGNLASSGASNPLAQGIFGPRALAVPGVFSGLANTEFAKQPFGGGDGIMSKVFPNYSSTPVSSAAFPKGSQELRSSMSATKPATEGIESVVEGATKKATEEGFFNQLGQFVSGDRLEGIPATVAGAGVTGVGAYLAADAAGLLKEEEEFNPENLSGAEVAAYKKWQTIANKNSPEAESLRTIWYGKPRYSDENLKRFFNVDERAAGGEIVGRGTGTSDSIPARLSDGEFVMTARAVRNAGNGDRDLGAARMYDMMNRFESGAA